MGDVSPTASSTPPKPPAVNIAALRAAEAAAPSKAKSIREFMAIVAGEFSPEQRALADSIVSAIEKDARFAKLDPQTVVSRILREIHGGTSLYAHEIKSFVDLIHADIAEPFVATSHAASRASSGGAHASAVHGSGTVRQEESLLSRLKNIETTHAISGWLSLLIAGMSAFSAFSNARGIRQQDENGQTHINPTAVGLTLVMGVLTAASTYLGIATLRAGMAR